MSVLAAAVVLAWICLVLLTFAMAGILRQLRELQATMAGGGTATSVSAAEPLIGRRPASLDKAQLPAVVLVASATCPLCELVHREYVTATAAPGDVRRLVISPEPLNDRPAGEHVRHLADAGLFGELEVPWTPALLGVDADGTVRTAEPVTSVSALPGMLARAAAAISGTDSAARTEPAGPMREGAEP